MRSAVDGSEIWHFELPCADPGNGEGPAVFDTPHARAYVVTCADRALSFDASSGERLATLKVALDLAQPPIVEILGSDALFATGGSNRCRSETVVADVRTLVVRARLPGRSDTTRGSQFLLACLQGGDWNLSVVEARALDAGRPNASKPLLAHIPPLANTPIFVPWSDEFIMVKGGPRLDDIREPMLYSAKGAPERAAPVSPLFDPVHRATVDAGGYPQPGGGDVIRTDAFGKKTGTFRDRPGDFVDIVDGTEIVVSSHSIEILDLAGSRVVRTVAFSGAKIDAYAGLGDLRAFAAVTGHDVYVLPIDGWRAPFMSVPVSGLNGADGYSPPPAEPEPVMRDR